MALKVAKFLESFQNKNLCTKIQTCLPAGRFQIPKQGINSQRLGTEVTNLSAVGRVTNPELKTTDQRSHL